MLKRDSPENTTFCHSAHQWWRSRAHCILRRWWSLDNGSRCNGMQATSPALKRQWRTVEADRSKPVAVLQCQLNTVDETVQSVTAMQTRWRSSCAVVTLRGPVPARLCIRPSSLHWFHIRITVIAACPVRAAMSWYGKPASRRPTMLILRLFMSTRHTCTSFHVSTLFGSSALTEQGITLTLLVTQEMSLLGLCVCHLSGNVINYWWYTGLHISQILESFGPFHLGVALPINSIVAYNNICKIILYI